MRALTDTAQHVIRRACDLLCSKPHAVSLKRRGGYQMLASNTCTTRNTISFTVGAIHT
jgi:hypothetical protein